MNKQKKRILALLVAMAFTVGSQAQVFGLGGEAEGPATRSNNPGLFWIGKDGGGNNGGQWNGVNSGATLLGFEEDDAPLGGGATLQGFEDGDAPLGGGLLVLALSGVCYAGAKRVKGLKSSN